MRELRKFQREQVAQHIRNGRCLQQLGRRHTRTRKTSDGTASDREIQSLYNRRGTYVVHSSFQCFLEDTRGAARICNIYPCHYRKTQDIAYHNLAVPDIRLQPHTNKRYGRLSQICRPKRKHRCRDRGSRSYGTEGRRSNAGRTIDFRPNSILLWQQHHLQGSHRYT